MAKSNLHKKDRRKATKKEKKDIIQSEIIIVLSDDECKRFTIRKILRRIKRRSKDNSEVAKYLSEKVIRKNIKKLIKNGKVTSYSLSTDDGNDVDTLYEIKKKGSQTDDENNTDDSGDKLKRNGAEEIPFAELMRRRSSNKENSKLEDNPIPKSTNNNNGSSLWDLDDEISRLEKELLASDGNDSNDEESSDASEHGVNDSIHKTTDDNSKSNRKRTIQFGETTILNEEDDKKGSGILNNIDDGETGVICLSEFANDRIAPLPQTALPSCKSKKLKIDKVSSSEDSRIKRKNDKSSEGLRDAVKEVLAEYTPRTEKIPFYCRVCSHSSSNQQEFLIHKRSDFHKMAVQMEKKASYCNICRKQLTSITQLQEHLQSKPHRDKLQYLRSRQKSNKVIQKNKNVSHKSEQFQVKNVSSQAKQRIK